MVPPSPMGLSITIQLAFSLYILAKLWSMCKMQKSISVQVKTASSDFNFHTGISAHIWNNPFFQEAFGHIWKGWAQLCILGFIFIPISRGFQWWVATWSCSEEYEPYITVAYIYKLNWELKTISLDSYVPWWACGYGFQMYCSWSGGQVFELQSGRTWGAWYFYLSRIWTPKKSQRV